MQRSPSIMEMRRKRLLNSLISSSLSRFPWKPVACWCVRAHLCSRAVRVGVFFFCFNRGCVCTAGVCVCVCVCEQIDRRRAQTTVTANSGRLFLMKRSAEGRFCFSASHPDGLHAQQISRMNKRGGTTRTHTHTHANTPLDKTEVLPSMSSAAVCITIQSFYLVCTPREGVDLTGRGLELCIFKQSRGAGILERRDESEASG